MIQVTDIYIYPVKSLKGIPLKEAETGLRGFKYDREWMITDSDYQFLTQRQIEAMATITVSISRNCLLLQSKDGDELKVDPLLSTFRSTLSSSPSFDCSNKQFLLMLTVMVAIASISRCVRN
jgi:hypothetical protein